MQGNMSGLEMLLKLLSKQGLRTIFVLLLITSLSGCKAPETSVERCLIDMVNQQCLCHKYEINKDYIGRIGPTYEEEYEHCDKMVGFTAHNWWEIRAYLGRVQAYFNNEKK